MAEKNCLPQFIFFQWFHQITGSRNLISLQSHFQIYRYKYNRSILFAYS